MLRRNTPGTKPVDHCGRRCSTQNIDRCLNRARGDVYVDAVAKTTLCHAVHRGVDQLDRCQHVGVKGLDPSVTLPVAEITRWWAALVMLKFLRTENTEAPLSAVVMS